MAKLSEAESYFNMKQASHQVPTPGDFVNEIISEFDGYSLEAEISRK